MDIDTIIRGQEDVDRMVKYSLDLIAKGAEKVYTVPPMKSAQISEVLVNFNKLSIEEVAEMIGKAFADIKNNYSDEVVSKYTIALRKSFKNVCKCAMRVDSICRHRSSFIDEVFIDREVVTRDDLSTIIEGYAGEIRDIKDFIKDNPKYEGLIKYPFTCVVKTVNTLYKKGGAYNIYAIQFLGNGYNFIVDFRRYNKMLSRAAIAMEKYGIYL